MRPANSKSTERDISSDERAGPVRPVRAWQARNGDAYSRAEPQGGHLTMMTLARLLAAASLTLAGSVAHAQDANAPLPDPAHIPFTVPENIPWEGDAARG